MRQKGTAPIVFRDESNDTFSNLTFRLRHVPESASNDTTSIGFASFVSTF